MLIPAIDVMGGHIVQLVSGEKKAYDVADFQPWIEKFQRYPLVHVVDLDAAMRAGSNRRIVEELCKKMPCQVGGGIGSADEANAVLGAGAKRVVIGSALVKDEKIDTDFATKLSTAVNRKSLVFSVDTKQGLLALSGWRKTVHITAEEAIRALEPYCGAFLHTHIDTGAGMGGFPMQEARDLVAVTKRHLMMGGGIRSLEEVQELDVLGVDAIVGMAIYSGVLAV